MDPTRLAFLKNLRLTVSKRVFLSRGKDTRASKVYPQMDDLDRLTFLCRIALVLIQLAFDEDPLGTPYHKHPQQCWCHFHGRFCPHPCSICQNRSTLCHPRPGRQRFYSKNHTVVLWSSCSSGAILIRANFHFRTLGWCTIYSIWNSCCNWNLSRCTLLRTSSKVRTK